LFEIRGSRYQSNLCKKSKDFFQRIEKPNGKNFNSWVLPSAEGFLFGCGSSAFGIKKRLGV
jgi:hypothetical protein